jgi:hypothetical protein
MKRVGFRRESRSESGDLRTVSKFVPARAAAPALAAALAFATALAGCATSPLPPTQAPSAKSIAGLEPVGAVTMTQTFVGGSGVGRGTLTFQGQTYSFKLVGSVVGLGAVSRTQATGEVYNLTDISQFSGAWIEGSGTVGVNTADTSELWLQNSAGVIMHLKGQREGISLSLGRNALIISLGYTPQQRKALAAAKTQ